MQTAKYFSEFLAGFCGVALLSHLGVAYTGLRYGVAWMFGLAVFGAIAYALVLIALHLVQQQEQENQSTAIAIFCATPAAIVLLIIIMGGLTGVFTAWQ